MLFILLFFYDDICVKVSYVLYFKRLHQLKEFPTECPLCELKYKFSAAKSSFLFEHDEHEEQRVGGYVFYTATVGEAYGRALSRIFSLLWAIFNFFLLLFFGFWDWG